jgi:hypothetical protein
MGKNIIYPYITFTQFVDEPNLKRLALFFDNIYIAEERFGIISGINSSTLKQEYQSLLYEKSVWDYLREQGIVKTYSFPYSENILSESNEAKILEEQMLELMKNMNTNKTKSSTTKNTDLDKIERMNSFYTSHDICVRFDALRLRKDNLSEYYPLLRTNSSIIQKEKKSEVIQFLLNDIPEPDFNTPWEQIIDFRTDENVKNKYLALMNWVNKVASTTTTSLSDVKEEYEYLYSEYIKHFKLHKMKYNNTLLEVVVNASTAILLALQTGDFVSTFKNLFQLNSTHANLLSEEGKLPGKEVAYIYHTKGKFS